MAGVGQDRDRVESALTPVGVSLALDEVRRLVDRQEDSGLAAVLEVADALAARWLAQRGRVEDCRRAHEEALRASESSAVQLELVIRTLEQLSTPENEPEALPVEAPRRVGWLRRLRGSGGVPPPRDPPLPTPGIVAAPVAAGDASADEGALGVDEVTPPGGEPPLSHDEAADERSLFTTTPPEDVPWPDPDPATPVDAAVHLLGDFRLVVRGRPLEAWQGAKSQRVIRYLMAHPRRPVPKDVLIDAFWPETSADAGRRNLHQAVYMIRKTVRDHDADLQLIIHDSDAYAVNAQLEVWCDAEEFEAEVRVARTAELAREPERAIEAYAAAERCYHGDFLQDSPYEEWALAERDRLRLLYTEAANHLGDLLLERGAVEAALHLSQRLIGRDPCDEEAHRRAMRCFAATGRRTLVVRQYRACVDALARVLELGPSSETAHLYASLIAD